MCATPLAFMLSVIISTAATIAKIPGSITPGTQNLEASTETSPRQQSASPMDIDMEESALQTGSPSQQSTARTPPSDKLKAHLEHMAAVAKSK